MTDWAKYCDDLLADNGLTGWRTEISRGRRTIGMCMYNTKTIKLSKYHLEKDDDVYIKDTIIHEVAHALNPDDKHGPSWRKTARALGGTGDQYTKHSDYPSKWATMCANGHESKMFRWNQKSIYNCKCGSLMYIRRSDKTEITLSPAYVDRFNRLARSRRIPLIDRQGLPQI